MAKVTISKSKGLVQEKGSGFNVKSTTNFKSNVTADGQAFTGHNKGVKVLDGTATVLTAADSGKLFLVGGGGATHTHTIPVGVAGWHGTFMITGSIAADVVLSGAAASSSAAVSLVGHIQ